MPANTSGALERRWLRAFALTLTRRLKTDIDVGGHFADARPRSYSGRDLDGWGSFLGYIGHDEVWVLLDRHSGRSERLPWVGIFIRGEVKARRTYEHLRRHHPHALLLSNSEIVSDGRHSRLARPLTRQHIGQPVLELHDDQYKAIGIYLSRPISFTSPPGARITALAERFLKELLVGYAPPPRTTTAVTIARHSVTIKRARVSSGAMKRDSRQAVAAKERDGYRCRICDLVPEKQYGVVGRSCLEAHHLEELGHRRLAVSRLDDVVTVCANCHRALHSLPSAERQFADLRRRFRRRSSR